MADLDRTLADIELLSDVPRHALEALEAHHRWHRIGPTELIIDGASTEPHGVFLLADGEVEVHRSDGDGGAIALGRLVAPDCFGEFAAILGMPSSASVRACTHCLVAEIAQEAFLGLLNDHPPLSLRLLRKAVTLVRVRDQDVLRLRDVETILAEAYRNAVLRSL